MRSSVGIIYMIVFSLACSTSLGTEITPFPTTPNQEAEQRISRYLDTGNQETGRSAYLEALETQGLAAVDAIFKAVLIRWNQGTLDPGTRRRVDSALRFAQKIAWSSRHIDRNLLEGIKIKADQLLIHYAARSEGQAIIISILNKFHIWTATNFWFFLKYSKSTADLMESASRLREVIALLDEDQLNNLAEAIREIRPYSLVQLSLLMDTGQLKESELVVLFKLAANRFAKRQNPSLDDSIARQRYEEKTDIVFAPTFARIVHALHSDEAPVVSAMNKARSYWERQESSPIKGDHMRLFESLGNESMDWLRSDTWVAKRFTGAQRDYTVEDNVILVNFKIARSCEDNLN